MTQYPPNSAQQRVSLANRILITVFAVVAPVAVVIAWWTISEADFNYTFEDLRRQSYIPIVFSCAAVALGVPIVVILHSLVLMVRRRGRRIPMRGIISGAISLFVALPLLFEALPLLTYEIDLGHAPTTVESSVSSATLLGRAKKFEDATAVAAGEQIIRRDAPTSYACDLSNGHPGHGYNVVVRMNAPARSAATTAALAYWKSLGYAVERTGIRYSAAPVHQLAPALVVTLEVFEVTVTTSCATH